MEPLLSLAFRRTVLVLLTSSTVSANALAQSKPRARDLGVPFVGSPGPNNAITDVAGVRVGHTTLISGEGELRVGEGPVRTGVTVILPRGNDPADPVFGGWFALNGNGEMTGTAWIEESGFLEGPIAITNTHSVGVVRDAIIAYKRGRRMALGDRATLLFEDRETLRFQVQEMVWVERIGEPEKIQNEIDVYNELMPGDRELSATLFIEITDLAEIRPELERLTGLDKHVALSLEARGDSEAIPARFDAKQFEPNRISAVQYIRFSLSDSQAERFVDLGVRAAIRIDHPQYRHEIEIPPLVRASLISTLHGDPKPLLQAPSS